jgi:hypothetical protein
VKKKAKVGKSKGVKGAKSAGKGRENEVKKTKKKVERWMCQYGCMGTTDFHTPLCVKV